MSILLVDPVPHIRRFYAANLNAAGFPTREAPSIEAAWHEATLKTPDMIIMEVCFLSRGTGMELLDLLAASPRTAAVPVLLVTSQSDVLPQTSRFGNVCKVLIKPISRHELLVAVHHILRHKVTPDTAGLMAAPCSDEIAQ